MKHPPMMVYGASLGPHGGALAGALHDETGVTVTEFFTYPATLAAIGQELLQLPQDSMIFVDAGLHGLDLWHFLGRRKPDQHWRLFEAARPELRRAELVGRLRAAYEQRAFTIQSGELVEADTLRKALSVATREDAHERVEVAALSLAVVDRRPPPRAPLFIAHVRGAMA